MKLIEIALKEYATHEVVGTVTNPRIQQYFNEIGRPEWKQDEIPWCAVFMNWCLIQIGLPTCGQGLAESFAIYGTETITPELGDIVVFEGTKNGDQMNHVAIFIRKLDNRVYFLGGNQDNQVNISSAPETWVSEYRKLPNQPIQTSQPNKFKELQTLLNKWGAKLVVDGKFGPLSKAALNNFLK